MPMGYDTLLFDVDNTLLDFDANEEESFRCMLLEKGETWTEEMFQTYRRMNEEMWKSIERGELDVDTVVNTRFSKFMAGYGKAVDGVDWEKTYRRYLNLGIQEMPEVHEVLSELNKHYRMYVITNGIGETQESRMERSGLSGYFAGSFISQQVGAGKPSAEFFNHVKTHVDGFCPERTLVIGDSLTSDIKGGYMAGLDTCWFCKEETKNRSGIDPTYVIHRLSELLPLLNDSQKR